MLDFKATGPMKTVREVTLDLLRSFGISKVFGNPGSTELTFLHDWPDDIAYVLALQEASAIGMADGYAQATGNAGFVNLHSAAGLGHALGNLFTSFRIKTPLVITAGQQSRSILPYQPYLYAEQATQFPRPYVKWSVEPARAEDVPTCIAQAYYIAMQHPRGPTFVSIPSDDWTKKTPALRARDVYSELSADPAAIQKLAEAIGKADNVAFVAGPTIDRSGAVDLMVELAEKCNAPVWASPMSSRASFPERHRLFAGFLQAAPEPLSKKLEPYDLIVVFGAPVFTFHIEGRCDVLHSGVPLWQITDDPTEAAIAAVGTSVLSTLPSAIRVLLGEVAPKSLSERNPIVREAVAMPAADGEPMNAEFLLSRLSAALPEGAIVVEEAPSHRPAIQRHLPMSGADSFYTMASGGLGYSLPASVGVALAREGRRIVCLIGDGSTMYSVQAIWTAVQHKLPVTIIVLNNSGYGAMRTFSRILGAERPPGIDLPGIDFVKMAEAFGCAASRIHRAADVDAGLRDALTGTGPRLLEVIVDPAISEIYSVPNSH